MSLATGARLGPYEITAPLGAGGMGEVWRARDTTLGRDVALKILPDHLALDPDRLARFKREAQILASLNHPNIASIYGFQEADGVQALVLELVEGPTLADRIKQDAIPVDEALPIAKQIAEALEAAHEQGIIHRDLKPANIKLRPDGTVKVLDFGLAKALEPTGAVAASAMSMSPTITSPAATHVGVILGTAAYMSPEQARGKAVDKRADIWAFGCVLFEMLTARRLFFSDEISDTLALILTKEPDWRALPSTLYPAIVRLLRRCLEKETNRRLRDIGDARLEIEDAMRGPQPERVSPQRRQALIPALVGVGALVAGAFIASRISMLTSEESRPIRRFVIELPDGDRFSATNRHIVAVSPDATHLVYVADQRLYLRTMNQLEATPIRGTEEGGAAGHARSPFFSPDGQWIGFWQSGQLKKVSINGGAPLVVCAAANLFGASWGANDTILFGQGPQGISQVSASGGQPTVLVSVESENQVAHGPQMLPGGKAVLFTLTPPQFQLSAAAFWDNAQIVVQSLDSGQRKVLVQGGKDARYVSTGHLLYVRQGTLFAVPFDPVRLVTTGSPFPVVDGIEEATTSVRSGVAVGGGTNFTGAAQFAVSENGLFVYVPQGTPASVRTLAWVDRQGRETALSAPDRAYMYPRISPDGTRVALDIRDQEQDIWVWDFGRETLTRFTFDAAADILPVWTRDGHGIVFSRVGQGIFRQTVDATGAAERITEIVAAPTAFSPDETRLVMHRDMGKDTVTIQAFIFEGKRTLDLLMRPMVTVQNADISPDGRWLAYQSNESGQFEIYVRPFPDVQSGRWQVSRAGGTRPLWARSGRELFYLALPTQPVGGTAASGNAMMAVPIESGPGFRAGNPTKLFAGLYFAGLGARAYDVSPDGQRFLMIKDKTTGPAAADRIIVVENFFEELKRPVPTN